MQCQYLYFAEQCFILMELSFVSQDTVILVYWVITAIGVTLYCRQTEHTAYGTIKHFTSSLECETFCWQEFCGKDCNQKNPLSIK